MVNILGAIYAGFIGTFIMMLFMFMAPLFGASNFDINSLIGTLFTADKNAAPWIGGGINFLMGAVFSILYAVLWGFGVGAPLWYWGLTFGAVQAFVVLLLIPVLLRVHPRPPEVKPGPGIAFDLGLGHLIFGLITALIYTAVP